MGEVAAAHVAGALSLADAVKVICRRSRRLRAVAGRGGMAVVELSTEEAQAALADFEDRLSVAVSNGPRSTVIAGDPVALEQVIASLTEREVFCRPVKVDVASHSPQVDALRPVLLDDLAEVRPVAATVPIYSTVDAAVREGGAFGAQYWVRNLREPVRFFDALRELLADGYDAFIEMSPHPVLLSAVEDAIAANAPDAIALPSLRREEDEREGLFRSLARLYACGATPRWKQLWPVAGTVIQLPGYPWQRERYWLERTLRGNRRSLAAGQDTAPGHPLLGQSVDLASAATRVWESVLELRRAPFAGDHRLRGAPVLAASAMVEMMLAASRLSSGSDAIELADVVFERDLFLRDGAEAAELQVHATSARSTGEIDLAIFARSERGWSKYACARARALTPMSPQPVMASPPSGPPLDADAVYGALARVGMEYGPHLRAITELRRGEGVAAATFVAPAGAGVDRCVVAPAILDACFQLAALARGDVLEHETLEVPRSIDLVRCWRSGGVRSTAIASRTAGPAGSDVVDVMTGDEEGAASLELRGLRRQPFGVAATIGDPPSWLYEAAWESMALVDTEAPAGRWLLLANAGGASAAFALALDAALRSAGATTRTVVLDGAVEDAIDRARAADGPWSGVIHCAGLDALPAPALTAAALSADPVPGADSLLAALRSLDVAAWGGAPRLWVITRGATVVSAPDRVALAIAQSPLWGLARVIETEHPSRFASVFDLDPAAALDRQAAQLADELGRNGEEPAVAMRGNVRCVQRLRPLAPTRAVRRVTCRRDATYLITGGLGGVGVAVASWLIAQGARRLVILGRTPIPPRSGWRSLPRTDPSASRVREIQRLEALGAAVHYLAVNVADPAAVADALLHWRGEGWPPIRGIIHSAADFDDRLLTDIDAPSLSKVFGPKAVGAWVLHEAVAEAEWVVLFSSLASLHPSPGQGSYAAANAFLDAFAQYLSGNAEQALSVSWGLWSDTGFSATAGGGLTKARLAEQGIRGFSPADGLVAFEALLERNVSHAALFATDRRTFPMGIGGREVLPLLRGLGVTATAGGAAPVSGIKRVFVDEWRAADGPQRARLLEARIAHHISTVLKLADGRLDPQKPLGDYGLNSILGLELRQRLERDLELRLSATLIWNYPTVAALAAHLGARLDPGATPAVPSERVAPRATTRALGGLLARVEHLSDEAALAALRAPKARGTQ
jgi:NAD(P)-dependent dehydrogenase (short-subunit alcohol dehydrogenase family)/acyl carrier protein